MTNARNAVGPGHMRARSFFALLIVASTLVVAAIGCSTADDASTNEASSSGDSAQPELQESTSGRDATATGEAAADATAETATPPVQQSIIRTASIALTSKNPAAVSEKAQALTESVGGVVFGQEASLGDDATVTLTLKVPPAKLSGFLVDLAKLGTEVSRSQNSEDVTGQVVDLDARIAAARISVDRVRGFLNETKNVGELAGIEAELTRRETQLEVLIGQQRTLGDRVAMATVTLNISEKPVVTNEEPGDFLEGVPGFGGALASGFNGLVGALRVAAAGLGFVAPFAIVGLLAWFVVSRGRRLSRARARKHTPAPTDAPSPVDEVDAGRP